MPGQADLDPGETALGAGGAEDAGAGEGAQAEIVVVGHEEIIGGGCLEALFAAPSHVLDHEQGAVGDEDVVELAVRDDGAVESLDHTGEHRQPAGRGRVVVQHAVGAFGPRLDGRVNGFLHVAAVEVDFCS